jgi:hypothetical protein
MTLHCALSQQPSMPECRTAMPHTRAMRCDDTVCRMCAPLASFCRETPRLRSPDLSYAHGPGTKCQWMPGSASSGRVVFGLVLGLPGGLTVADPLSRDRSGRGGLRIGQAACRRRDDCFSSIVAILMRLLASTAAPTHNSKRSRPSARQRFMPRPRNSTEMRPSMPARKR